METGYCVSGKLDQLWVISSESCGLDVVGAEFVRDVEAEMVVIDDEELNPALLRRPAVLLVCLSIFILPVRTV